MGVDNKHDFSMLGIMAKKSACYFILLIHFIKYSFVINGHINFMTAHKYALLNQTACMFDWSEHCNSIMKMCYYHVSVANFHLITGQL